jgi:hypothetical protein
MAAWEDSIHCRKCGETIYAGVLILPNVLVVCSYKSGNRNPVQHCRVVVRCERGLSNAAGPADAAALAFTTAYSSLPTKGLQCYSEDML